MKAKMCDVCGEEDPRVPKKKCRIRGFDGYICAMCEYDVAKWLPEEKQTLVTQATAKS